MTITTSDNDIKERLSNNRDWTANFVCTGEGRQEVKQRSLLQLRNFEGSPLLVFVEFFNLNWTLQKGKVRFELKLDNGKKLEIDGESWRDSLIHDLVDEKVLSTMLAMLINAKSVQLLSANGTTLAQFSLDGIKEALGSMLNCSTSK